MEWQLLGPACAGAALVLLAGLLALARRMRRLQARLREMEGVLAEIEAGNGGRRLLAAEGSPLAPLAYQLNGIVCRYEAELAALRRAGEANRQLMTSLSHDVRTPLTTLIGYLDAVHRGVAVGPEREEYLEIARRKSHELKDYIDLLFDWFKLNSDEYPLQLQPAELAELTRELLKDWVPVFEEAGLQYEVDIPGTPLPALLDADAYARILNNLLQNVLAHSGAGTVSLAVRQEGGALLVQVADDGVGIPPADLPHIFDRLYKCDKARGGRGSGLGLSIAQQLAGRMDGSLAAESTPGRRTAFTLRLPAQPRAILQG